MSNCTYDKRGGVTGAMEGHMLEIKLIMLLVLQANIHKFKYTIATSMTIAGNLDDVVAIFENPYQLFGVMESIVVFLQAKHVQSPDKLQITYQELTGKNKFGLNKYFKSFETILKNRIGLCAKQFYVNRSEIIIFTNTSIEENTLQYFYNTTSKFNQILNTEMKNIYKIKEDKFNEFINILEGVNTENKIEFLKKLKFYVNQPNDNEIKDLILNGMRDYYNLQDEIKLHSSYVIAKDLFQVWWSLEGKNVRCLDENSNYYSRSLASLPSSNITEVNTLYYKNIGRECRLIFKENTLQEMKKIINENQIVIIKTVQQGERFSLARLFQVLTTEQEKDVLCADDDAVQKFQDEMINCFDVRERRKILIYVHKNPSGLPIDKIREILNRKRENKLIIISSSAQIKMNSPEFQEIYTSDDLIDESRYYLLDTCIKFQGKLMELKDLFDKLNFSIGVEMIARLLAPGEPLEIGTEFQFPAEFEKWYIPRKFTQDNVTTIFQDTNDIFFLDLSTNKDNNDPVVLHYLELCKTKVNVFCSHHKSLETLHNKYPNLNVHWLVLQNDKLTHKNSTGSSDLVKKYLEVKEYSSKDLISSCDEQPVIVISDIIGMGKSTVLYELLKTSANLQCAVWTIRLELNKCTALLTELSKKTIDLNSVSSFILKAYYGSINETDTLFFTLMTEKSKVVLLLDGFDEIMPKYQEIVVDVIKYLKNKKFKQIYVTTRPHDKQRLEQEFNILSYKLVEFTPTEQQLIVENELKSQNQHDSTSKVEKIIKELESLTSTNDISICAIPLVLTIVPHYCNPVNELTINLCTVYRNLMKRKIKIYLKKTNITFDEKQQIQAKEDLQKMELIAANLIFGDQITMFLNNVEKERMQKENIDKENKLLTPHGIVLHIEKDKSQFVHRTVAEFLAAEYLLTKIIAQRSEPMIKFFVLQILVSSNYKTIRQFLNDIIKTDKISKLSINFLNVITKKIANNNSTPLHIAAEENNFAIVRLLVKTPKNLPAWEVKKYSANLKLFISVKNKNNETAHDIAERMNNLEIADFLTNHIAVIKEKKQ